MNINTADIIESILRNGTNATELTKIISEAQRKINKEQEAEKAKLLKARTNFVDSMTQYFSIVMGEEPSQDDLAFVENELIKFEKDIFKFNKPLGKATTKSDNELIQEFLSKYCC